MLNAFDKNVEKEINEYKNSEPDQISFLEQFKLQQVVKNEISGTSTRPENINSRSISNIDSSGFNLQPYHDFERLNLMPGGRRDNSIVIKEHYKVPEIKKEKEPFAIFDKNDNVLGGLDINRKINRDIFNVNLKKNNDYDEKMYQPKDIPVTNDVRIKPRTQDDLRGKNENSKRLTSKNIINENGLRGEGKSALPPNITKFKKKCIKKQTTDDYLRTTGLLYKPEYRSKIRPSAGYRSKSTNLIGPAKNIIGSQEIRNNQKARPTHKESFVDIIHVTNMKSNTDRTPVRPGDKANPTNRSTKNNILGAPDMPVKKHPVYNKQEANPTLREGELQHLTNMSGKTKPYYKNKQRARETLREDETSRVSGPKSVVPKTDYRNKQEANPTIRENESNFVGPSNNSTIGSVVKNHQKANPTIREETQNTKNFGGKTVITKGYVYENKQPANVTLRNEMGNDGYSGTSVNKGRGVIVKNYQDPRDTHRTETGHTDYRGTEYMNKGVIYNNGQDLRDTHREDIGETNYSGPKVNHKESYMKSIDKTRSGVVEEVLARDYKGVAATITKTQESRLFRDNYDNHEFKERTLDRTERELKGGKGQIGVSKNNIGLFRQNDMKGMENNYRLKESVIKTHNVNYNSSRNRNSVQNRNTVNNNIPITLSGNPFINNMIHRGTSQEDNIRSTTLMSDNLNKC